MTPIEIYGNYIHFMAMKRNIMNQSVPMPLHTGRSVSASKILVAEPMGSPKGHRSGRSIVLVLCFLVILILSAIVFWTLSRVQSITPSGYIDQFRAKILAQTGLERAVSEFHSNPCVYFISDGNEPWIFRGEDSNRNGVLDKSEDQNDNNNLDIAECALEKALAPSFAGGIFGKVNDIQLGYTAIISRNTGSLMDLYSLKIIDANSQIYINGNNKGTEKALNNLGRILGIHSALGEKIAETRNKLPSRAFSIKEEIKEIIGEKKYKKLEPYITVWGAANVKVVKPKPFNERPVPCAVGQEIVRVGQMNPGALDIEPRVPVNINTASETVMLSILLDLSGLYLATFDIPGRNPLLSGNDEFRPNRFNYLEPPLLKIGVIKESRLDEKQARGLVKSIVAERRKSPFLSWDQFNKFIDKLVGEEIFGPAKSPVEKETAQAKADLVKANANPNTRLNDFNPNTLLFQLVDKSDLTVYTTEFCFQPQGFFEVESAGIVVRVDRDKVKKENGKSIKYTITGLQKMRQVLKFYDVYYETTQQDFSRGDISGINNTNLVYSGKTLQTYPEPAILDYPDKCTADGQIMKSTTQNMSENKKGNTLLTLKLHFGDKLNASYSAGNPGLIEEMDTKDKASLARPHNKSLFDSGKEGAGAIYPDGAYSEAFSTPAYGAENNLVDAFAHETLFGEKRFRGTISFWFKPNYPEYNSKPRTLFSMSQPYSAGGKEPMDIFSLFLVPANYKSQKWIEIDQLKEPQFVWLCETEESGEKQFSGNIFSNSPEKSKGWMHIGIAWDTNPSVKTEAYPCPNCRGKGRIVFESLEVLCSKCGGLGRISNSQGKVADMFAFCVNGHDKMQYIDKNREKYLSKISEHINYSENNILRLGARYSEPYWNATLDGTIDEFTVQIHDSTQKAKEFIISEYRSGRYYKGEGVFTSGLIDLGTADSSTNTKKTLLCRADWTAYSPRSNEKAESSPRTGAGFRSSQIIVQLLDENNNVLKSSSFGESVYLAPLANGKAGRIKYCVTFKRQSVNTSEPIIETEVFDDILITLIKPEPQLCESYLMP